MGKIYLYSKIKKTKLLLEMSDDQAADTITKIVDSFPGLDFAIYGAKDLDTLHRVHNDIISAKVVSTIQDFQRSFLFS